MMKQVPKTDRIKSLIAKAVGDPDANTDGLAVYEAVIANGKPLRRDQGLYAGAVIQQDAMSGMNDHINSGDHIPLQAMHRSGLPLGKVFHSEMKPTADGGTKVHALFYLPKAGSDYVHKIDTGVINDVSVGFMPKSLQCSACGFDYMGDTAGFNNIYDCVCDKGHKIGKDGVHARVHGVSSLSELSLVNRGAVNGGSILPRPQQSAGANPNMARFAALGIDERPFYLAASMSEFDIGTKTPTQENPIMEKELIELKANAIVAGRDLAAKDAQIADLTAKLATAEAATIQATANLSAALATDGVKAKADLAEAMSLVHEFGKATFAANGKPDTAMPETVSATVALVRQGRADLSASLVAGGRSVPAATGTKDDTTNNNFAAFKRA
jgi:hypothetical protein